MTTLLEAAIEALQNLEVGRDYEPGNARVILRDAIAQEQTNKNAVPFDMVRFGGRCNIHPLNILPCASCEETIQWKLNKQKQHSQFGSPDMQALIIANLASQTADTNLLVSQKTAETVDKDCDTCNNRQRRMHQEPCFSCHGYTNWEPKP